MAFVAWIRGSECCRDFRRALGFNVALLPRIGIPNAEARISAILVGAACVPSGCLAFKVYFDHARTQLSVSECRNYQITKQHYLPNEIDQEVERMRGRQRSIWLS